MAVTNFIPTLWAGAVLDSLHKALVFGQLGVINRQYEGEILASGDSVKITGIGPVTVSDYAVSRTLSAPQELTSGQTMLNVDQEKSFHYKIDDVDAAQSNVNLFEAGNRESAYALRDTADQYIAGLMAAEAGSAVGTSAAPKTDLGTAGTAFEYLLEMQVLLDEANVPDMGRWCIVPPWFGGELLKDERMSKQGTTEGEGRLRNGFLGRIELAGFTVLKSNNVVNDGTTWEVVAGHGMATTFAEQVVSVEAYRRHDSFSDAVRGLHVYGAKVVRPEALVVGYFNRPS